MAYDLIRKEADRLEEAGKGTHKVNAMIRILRAAWYYFIDVLDLEMRNPFKKMKLYSVVNDPKYIPTDFDLYGCEYGVELADNGDEYISGLNERQWLLVQFCEETGCRISEAIRLKAQDVTETTVTLWTRKSKNSDLTPRVIPRPTCLKDKDIHWGRKWEASRVFPEWNWS
jgi:integrase